MDKVEHEPSQVTADDGSVIVDGPDGVAVTLTPDAAIETSERLFEAGVIATGQDAIKRRAAERRRPQSLLSPEDD